jgi:hypothetical protein
MLSEIITPLIVFLGLIIGNILAFIAPEEIRPYQKTFIILKKALYIIVAVFLLLTIIKESFLLPFYIVMFISLTVIGINSATKFTKNNKIAKKGQLIKETLKNHLWSLLICYLPTITSYFGL